MRDEHTVICSPAVFDLIAPDAPPVSVKVDLTYHSRDPYAVQASFRTGNGRPSTGSSPGTCCTTV